jgi:hypothetical protein
LAHLAAKRPKPAHHCLRKAFTHGSWQVRLSRELSQYWIVMTKQNKRRFSPCPCRLRFLTHKCVIPCLSRRLFSMQKFAIQLMVKSRSAVGSVMRHKCVKKIHFSARMAELANAAPIEGHSPPGSSRNSSAPAPPQGRSNPKASVRCGSLPSVDSSRNNRLGWMSLLFWYLSLAYSVNVPQIS